MELLVHMILLSCNGKIFILHLCQVTGIFLGHSAVLLPDVTLSEFNVILSSKNKEYFQEYKSG